MPDKSLVSPASPSFPCPRSVPKCCPYDESFQFIRFKTKTRLLWFHGVPPPSSEVREVGWGSFSVCFVWLWLLCSWHLSPFPLPAGPSPTIFFLHNPLPVLRGNCTGPLHVRACVRVYIHV
uniref:Uncharacterized protein n=1 Tax=Pipistrellus kuhlii TaxID=59472 RepID=A0A7J7ZJ67_PIPKU|nr:hypothetical protein mPipKuh1_009430 [Pipistrellus kuhlii]